MYNPILANDGLGDELPPALEKIRAQLREAGPLEEDDPIHALTERAMLGKAAAPGGEIGEQVRRRVLLEKLCGDEAEADHVPSEPVGDLLARASRSALLAKSMNPALRKAAGDWTWGASVGATSTGARALEAQQRHTRLSPESAPGEPLAAADGDRVEKWPGGMQSWTYRNGKIVRSKTAFDTDDGETIVEFFDQDANEIDEAQYNSIAA